MIYGGEGVQLQITHSAIKHPSNVLLKNTDTVEVSNDAEGGVVVEALRLDPLS